MLGGCSAGMDLGWGVLTLGSLELSKAMPEHSQGMAANDSL